jgi:GT2 family glycosyltransferase
MLAIIIVSWNVRDLLRACLSSLQRYPATQHAQRIVVVDNASTDESAAMVRQEFPAVQLVANTLNRGFTGGNNDGIHAAEEWFGATDPATSYVLLLNPDTEIHAGTLDAMLNFAETHPQSGLIGPQLLYPDGAIQSSRRRFPTLMTALFESTWLQPYAPRQLLDDFYMRGAPDDLTCDVDWVYGAAMLVRRSAYQQVGLLDEQTFFMYSEEVDWCKRLKDAGWQIVYLPQAKITHYEGRSSAQASARRMILFNTSKVRYFRKHHSPLKATLLRVALMAMFTFQLLLESAKWLIGHKRPMRQERISAYRAVLKSQLK